MRKIRPAQIGQPQIGFPQTCASQVGMPEIGPSEARTRQIGVFEICMLEITVAEIRFREIGPGKVRATENRPEKVGAIEIKAGQVCRFAVSFPRIQPSAMSIHDSLELFRQSHAVLELTGQSIQSSGVPPSDFLEARAQFAGGFEPNSPGYATGPGFFRNPTGTPFGGSRRQATEVSDPDVCSGCERGGYRIDYGRDDLGGNLQGQAALGREALSELRAGHSQIPLQDPLN